jgi:7,8-dihydroneopterin aldolase/epimerase/oxygenase
VGVPIYRVNDYRMDKIFLRQLAVSAVIGVHDHEKNTPQTLFLDVELAVDLARAAATDDITATIDYSAVYHYLCEYIPTTHFQLLETLAADVTQKLIQKFSLSWLRLTVTKHPTDMPHLQSAGITVEWPLF